MFGGFLFGLRRPQTFQMAYFAGSSPPISIHAVQNDLFWAMLLLSKPTDLTLQAGAPFPQNPKKGLEIRFELFIGHWLHMPSPGFSKSITSLTQPQTPFQVRRGEGEIWIFQNEGLLGRLELLLSFFSYALYSPLVSHAVFLSSSLSLFRDSCDRKLSEHLSNPSGRYLQSSPRDFLHIFLCYYLSYRWVCRATPRRNH